MKHLWVLASFLSACLLMCVPTRAQVPLYQQPHNGSGTLYQSSWWDPDGYNADQYVWDSFVLPTSQAVTEIRWRGGFMYGGGFGGPVLDFRIAIYPSIAVGTEPDVAHPPLVQYQAGGNANQTPAGTFGGVAMYDYRFTLPSAFQATGGTKYWVHIYAYQHGVPEWGFAAATGGNGAHYRRLAEYMYQSVPGDTAFALYGSSAPAFTISASAVPQAGGAVMGAGEYPQGSNATLVAVPSPGFGFINWSENGASVGTSPSYTFTVSAPRSLVANFGLAHIVGTSASPSFGGTSGGDGTYLDGSSVTVTATPSPGYVFLEWSEYGVPVSSSPAYTFIVTGPRTLVANFVTETPSVLFDFDQAPLHTSLPLDITSGGITAHFSATGQGFSIQRADTMGFTPAGFAGSCIYPNSVFAADLHVSFSTRLNRFSILYSPQELGCDDSARMRVTAFLGAVEIASATATAPSPGTWPTGTLSLATTQEFDRVVVHYDARPPTCQDWGPIFLADNMVVSPSPGTAPCSAADVATAGSADPLAGPDGFLTGADFDVFLLAFFQDLRWAGGALIADLTDGTGSGPPDGFLTGADFDTFIMLFFQGC